MRKSKNTWTKYYAIEKGSNDRDMASIVGERR